jgi:hypothetical protein
VLATDGGAPGLFAGPAERLCHRNPTLAAKELLVRVAHRVDCVPAEVDDLERPPVVARLNRICAEVRRLPEERLPSERERRRGGYLTSVSSLNIGRYMLMMITPTIIPTAIIISGSMMLVSDCTAESTSSS